MSLGAVHVVSSRSTGYSCAVEGCDRAGAVGGWEPDVGGGDRPREYRGKQDFGGPASLGALMPHEDGWHDEHPHALVQGDG
ncbi:hypothetical protein GCM10022206_81490 [Streptomyces chiangmaiensis]